jgi:hypothetical protein
MAEKHIWRQYHIQQQHIWCWQKSSLSSMRNRENLLGCAADDWSRQTANQQLSKAPHHFSFLTANGFSVSMLAMLLPSSTPSCSTSPITLLKQAPLCGPVNT